MRMLVACPACRRQYDATGRPVGSRFRCRCGTIVTIAQPKGHDATVVRCASCGAPRRDGAMRCEFCGADFTLREQDLDTICPHCLARIGDGAQFCDHCGHPLAAEPLQIEETPLDCPTCGPNHRLNSRLIDGDEVSECPACAGIWIGTETFRQLVRHAGEDGQRADHRLPPPLHRLVCATSPESREHRHYVPCPVCRALMSRQNFGNGVIVDVCGRHGIWFDAEKLTCILDSVRAGGRAAANVELQAVRPRDAWGDGERTACAPTLSEDRDNDEGLVFPLVIAKAIGLLATIFGR